MDNTFPSTHGTLGLGMFNSLDLEINLPISGNKAQAILFLLTDRIHYGKR